MSSMPCIRKSGGSARSGHEYLCVKGTKITTHVAIWIGDDVRSVGVVFDTGSISCPAHFDTDAKSGVQVTEA
jgi:hypothetical protein